jgi:hypothetical protein
MTGGRSALSRKVRGKKEELRSDRKDQWQLTSNEVAK